LDHDVNFYLLQDEVLVQSDYGCSMDNNWEIMQGEICDMTFDKQKLAITTLNARDAGGEGNSPDDSFPECSERGSFCVCILNPWEMELIITRKAGGMILRRACCSFNQLQTRKSIRQMFPLLNAALSTALENFPALSDVEVDE
jgi:hypothetical protein